LINGNLIAVNIGINEMKEAPTLKGEERLKVGTSSLRI
jgi:hypothetical protein